MVSEIRSTWCQLLRGMGRENAQELMVRLRNRNTNSSVGVLSCTTPHGAHRTLWFMCLSRLDL